jgi:hypothetical protein
MASMTNAYGMGRGTSFAPCQLAISVPGVHYSVAFSGDDGRAGITDLEVTGVSSAGCDGQPVRVLLEGNSAGDPNGPPTEALGQFDSTRDPCTDARLTHPGVITDGQIGVPVCSTGATAQMVDVHDLTRVELFVRGQHASAQVLGEKATRGGSGSGVPQLPFTGSWAALTFWLGLVMVALGAVLLHGGRRRLRQID